MKADLLGIYDRGQVSKERVHFRALVEVEMSYYAIYDTFYTDLGGARISANQKSCYWFAPKKIKVGENIVVYTRTGDYSVETRENGSVYHFFFRNLNTPLYSDPNACAVLFELSTWKTTSPPVKS